MRTALFLLLLLAIGRPGVDLPAALDRPGATTAGSPTTRPPGPARPARGSSRSTPRPGSPRSTCCSSSRSSAASLPRHQDPLAPALRSRRGPRAASTGSPAHREETVDGEAEEVARAAAVALRGALPGRTPRRRTLSAEKGYLRETGNLVFHVALIGVLVGVAWGHLLGWKGDVIVPVGKTFANTLSRYDTFSPGPWVDVNALDPYTIKVDRLDATFETRPRAPASSGRRATSRRSRPSPTSTGERATQHPRQRAAETGGGSVFLLGNGYAPVITVRDAKGTVLYSDATPFLAQDNNYTSVGRGQGARRLAQAARLRRVLPAHRRRSTLGPALGLPRRARPAAGAHRLRGRPFPSGSPQSVYSLDTASMTPVPGKDGADQLRILLSPGQTYELPGGRGSITFDRVERFAGLSIRTDPGKSLTLVAALLDARRAGRLARHPSSKGVRAGWSGARTGSYCGVRRRPGQGRRRRHARRDRRPS